MQDRTVKRMLLKTYFKYHIPMIITAVACFMLSVWAGPRTSLGTTLLVLGCISFLAAPPVSFLLTKRKFEKELKKQGGEEKNESG